MFKEVVPMSKTLTRQAEATRMVSQQEFKTMYNPLIDSCLSINFCRFRGAAQEYKL